jgi:histidinol-phosphate aminotransferase
LDDAAHLSRCRENNAVGMKFYESQLKRLGIEYVPSHGNFILVRVGRGAAVFDQMQRMGVITRPMGGYKLPEWIRITVGTPAENERCLDAMKKALSK